MSPRKQNLTIVILAVLCVIAGLAVVLPGSPPEADEAAPLPEGTELLVAPTLAAEHERSILEIEDAATE